jgi:hypothetical protein
VTAIFNSLPVKEGAADRVVERIRESRGNVQGFPGFVSMEILSAGAGDEMLGSSRGGGTARPSMRECTARSSVHYNKHERYPDLPSRP